MASKFYYWLYSRLFEYSFKFEDLRLLTAGRSYFPACLGDIPVQLGKRNGPVCHLSPKQACEADVAVTREWSTKLV